MGEAGGEYACVAEFEEGGRGMRLRERDREEETRSGARREIQDARARSTRTQRIKLPRVVGVGSYMLRFPMLGNCRTGIKRFCVNCCIYYYRFCIIVPDFMDSCSTAMIDQTRHCIKSSVDAVHVS